MIKIEDLAALAQLTTEQLETQLNLATRIPPSSATSEPRFDLPSRVVNVITSETTGLNSTRDACD